MLNTVLAAAQLGVTRRRVLAMIKAGQIKATRLGGVWLIAEKDLAKVVDRKSGRPKTK